MPERGGNLQTQGNPTQLAACRQRLSRRAVPRSNGRPQRRDRGFGNVLLQSGFHDVHRGVLNRRYPLGWYIIDRGLREGAAIGHCIDFFMRDRSSAERVNSQLSTAVHECGHFLDMSLNGDAFVIRRDLSITCEEGDSTDRFGQTFARSRINDDDYSRLRPPCQGNRSPDCDSYADIYLDGDPDNESFEGGDQGFNMLAEEAVQYINSLATSYAVYDQSRYSTSARDGILTHLWWIQRYLAYARDRYPAAHQFLLGNECYRRLILTIWGVHGCILKPLKRLLS